MPDKKKNVRVSVDLEGDLAEAFLDVFGKRVAAGGSPSRGDMGRILMAEALKKRGYKVEVPETSWGGNRAKDDEQGQRAGLLVHAH